MYREERNGMIFEGLEIAAFFAGTELGAAIAAIVFLLFGVEEEKGDEEERRK